MIKIFLVQISVIGVCLSFGAWDLVLLKQGTLIQVDFNLDLSA